MIDLIGKTALVTGASRGIGAATARLLAESGANVMLLAQSASTLEKTTKVLLDEGLKVSSVVADVADYDSLQSAVRQCVNTFGGVDILVSNAGVIDPIEHLAESDPENWSRAIDVNVKGVYYTMRAAIPEMLSKGSGTIVNLSSGAANYALVGWSHYCASKAAVKRLTDCAHLELSEKNITVVGLSPGTVATDMMQTIRDSGVNPVSQLEWASHKTPEDVAKAILYLCGPEGRQFAGTDFSIKTEDYLY